MQKFESESPPRKLVLALLPFLLWGAPSWADGPQPLGAPFVVNTYTTSLQQNPVVAVAPSGEFVVAWSSYGSNGPDSYPILAQRWSPDGSMIGGEFQVNSTTPGSQYQPRLSMDGSGNFVAVWQSNSSSGSDSDGVSVQGRRFGADGTPIGGDFQVNTVTTGGQRYPDVAMASDGRFVVVWESLNLIGTGEPVMRYRRFDSSGAPVGDEVAIGVAPDTSRRAKVGIDDEGRFSVIWSSGGEEPDGQRFAWDGTDLGILESPSSSHIRAVDVAPDGHFVLVSYGDIQRFGPDGAPQGSPFQMGESMQYPAIDFEPGGEFAVVWQTSLVNEIRGQAFAADGTPRGGVFQAGSVVSHAYPSDVSVNAAGEMVVVWESGNHGVDGPDGSAKTIMGRRFRFPGPELSIAEGIPGFFGQEVTVPVELDTKGATLAAIGLSVDYDAACLEFDTADSNADGLPDALDLSALPAGWDTVVAFHDLGDADGELDLILSGAPPAPALPDGVLLSVSFMVTCEPLPELPITAPVGFSADPSPSFSDPSAQVVPGSSRDGSVQIFYGERGDCNGDTGLNVADFLATELEIFDGDGSFWLDAPDPTFAGDPVGCDSNADTSIDAGDMACTGLLIFGNGPCGGTPFTGIEAPRLTIDGPLALDGSGLVRVPIRFVGNGSGAHTAALSLDLGPGLSYVDASLEQHVPEGRTYVAFDAEDGDGELDLLVAGPAQEPSPWADGLVFELTLELVDSGLESTWIRLAEDPPASYGTVTGAGGAARVHTQAVPILSGLIFGDGFESGAVDRWSASLP